MIVIAVCSKTLGLSPIKTRLAKTIGTKSQTLYKAFLNCLRISLQDLQKKLPETIVYWAIAEPNSSHHWSHFPCLEQQGDTFGKRLESIHEQLSTRHPHATQLLLGGDSPQLKVSEILELTNLVSSEHHISIGPTSDGGFWGLSLRHNLPNKILTQIIYSQSNTTQQLISALPKNYTLEVGPLLTDVDLLEDLVALEQTLSQPSYEATHYQILKGECKRVIDQQRKNDPGTTRTYDRRIRNPVLYPTELRDHKSEILS